MTWSRAIWSSPVRSFPRYKIRNLPQLSVQVDYGSYTLKSFDTLSLTGFGFYTDLKVPDPIQSSAGNQTNRVFLTIDLGITNAPIKIFGDCVYSTKIQEEDEEEKLYHGVRFLEGYQFLMWPIIDHLEHLSELGKVESV